MAGDLIRAPVLGVLLCLGVSSLPAATPASAKAVSFNRDIRPIISNNCYLCHGPDEHRRKAGLRLDLRESALSDRDGSIAIVPGKPERSALWKRINAKDVDDRMPPQETHKTLTPQQITLLGDWIKQGAEYQPHWAFVPPQPLNPPKVRLAKWGHNGVDQFILTALEAKKLSPAPPAPKETLIRRLKLDLTGLPPTPQEVDAFLKDRRPDAYERLIDQFMAMPAYGEHQARYWLDAVRYGDTHGLHLDNERSLWPYRDWVVKAFNDDKPFDQFTVEQLAGDLLPNATRDQLVASGYNRCNVTTSEGGAIDAEFLVRYAVDRTETTATVWLGMTVGCAVCHDHKFDPITQKEFYRLYAFFNNAADAAMDGNDLRPAPTLRLPTPAQEKQLAECDASIARLEKHLRDAAAAFPYTDPVTLTNRPLGERAETVWVDDDFPAGAKPAINPDTAPAQWVSRENGQVYSGARALKRTDAGLAQNFFTTTNALTVGLDAAFFVWVYLEPTNPPKAIMLQVNDGSWDHRANWGDPKAISYGAGNAEVRTEFGPLPATGQWVRLEVEAAKLGLKPGDKIMGFAFTQFGGTVYWDKAGMAASTNPTADPGQSLQAWLRLNHNLGNKSKLPQPYLDLVKMDPAKRNASQNQQLRDYYLENVCAASQTVIAPIKQALNPLQVQRKNLESNVVSTLIMRDLEKARGAFVLKRGQYDQPLEQVTPGVPAIFPPLPASPTTNRLDLARWLVSPDQPLTARVTVNRFWQQFFGVGLVKTANDFGMQGEWPSNPELLDWLAHEFVAMHWDIKKFHRLLLTSAAYRQSSVVTPKLLQIDPENRLLSRGPRFRLDGEVIRDDALFVSGLLNPQMGGRGVRPYQPPGIWEAVAYTTSNTGKYTQDHGDALYRRSLYLFWKRTAPPPSMTIFDAPSHETSCPRRERSNTPLQALLLMNDVAYVESARNLATRMLVEGGSQPAERLRFGFRLVTARYPNAKELGVLKQSLDGHTARYQRDVEAAKKLLKAGESPVNPALNPAELAAYTMVANVLLNLDETVTKN